MKIKRFSQIKNFKRSIDSVREATGFPNKRISSSLYKNSKELMLKTGNPVNVIRSKDGRSLLVKHYPNQARKNSFKNLVPKKESEIIPGFGVGDVRPPRENKIKNQGITKNKKKGLSYVRTRYDLPDRPITKTVYTGGESRVESRLPFKDD